MKLRLSNDDIVPGAQGVSPQPLTRVFISYAWFHKQQHLIYSRLRVADILLACSLCATRKPKSDALWFAGTSESRK